MELPDVGDLNVSVLIGAGGCGSVCLADDHAGNLVAVKYFEGMAIRRSLLSTMMQRLGANGWPKAVMPLLHADFEGRPAMVVMPLHAYVDLEGELVPRSLQYRIGSFPATDPWPLLREVAAGLSEMHGKRVAHGNLKPGNIFIDKAEKVLLADWALGNMPGISHFEFTDALLYQPPEQLREPEGYLAEAGYRWDVYAFGTLAYRLLTGEFPRCAETFAKVAPEPGETRKDGIHADLPTIARNLEGSPEIGWPGASRDRREELLREWVETCLRLDPASRPATMMDVVAGFAEIEDRLRREEELETLMDQRRRAERRAWRWFFAAATAGGGALVLAGLWQISARQYREEKRMRRDETASLRSTAEASVRAMEEAKKAEAAAKQELGYMRDVSISRIQSARLVGDRLFSWAMEKGHRSLPPLDGREQRLRSLEGYFEEFGEKTSAVPELHEENIRIRLQLAEISLAAGDADKAIPRLSEAIEALKEIPMDGALRLRVATNRLLLALLLQSKNDPRMERAFVDARTALSGVPQSEVDVDRLQQLLAILDFHEAKFLSSRGDAAKALEQLMNATQTLNRLASQRPDSVVLRSELAACYLSSSTILEGMGNLGDARETQVLAAREIIRLLEKNPKDAALRLDLAGCYASMAEAAVLSADIAEAEARSAEAMKLLQELVRERPDHAEAVALLASQIGLRAGMMRDKGETAAAVKSFEDAIRMLEGIRASSPDNATVRYRLALLLWQKGRMQGMAGNRASEIDLLKKSYDLFTKLEADRPSDGPSAEKIQSSSGYLLGDLGHSLQLEGKKGEAKVAFGESAAFWERLLQSRPGSEEYQESLAWCRQRIKELP